MQNLLINNNNNFKLRHTSLITNIFEMYLLLHVVIVGHLLYLFGPSSRQNESVSVASSSKNSEAKASHHKLSLSC